MSAEEARRFVIGKMFSYSCFEGTRGSGRVFADGSVVGTIQLRGDGPVRNAWLPAGTIRVKEERVCASVRGMPIEPCFNLSRTDNNTFRGAVSGLGFAYCDFTRHRGRVTFTSNNTEPMQSRARAAAEACAHRRSAADTDRRTELSRLSGRNGTCPVNVCNGAGRLDILGE